MEEITLNAEDFWSRLKAIVKERNMTADQAYTEMGLQTKNMNNKKFRNTYPLISELVKISIYFGVSIDYLITGYNNNPLQKKVTDLEQRLEQIRKISSYE